MSPEQTFKERLKRELKMDLDLIVNDNRSTMLSLLDKRRKHAKISVHRMFLEAPDEVISAIAHYVRGTKRHVGNWNITLKDYINRTLPTIDYTGRVNAKALVHKGQVYHLKEFYNEINEEYFDNSIDLKITWYGHRKLRNKSSITFGQYIDTLKLIKMHRVLDDPFYPEFFVRSVLFHEMLHHLYPTEVDVMGRHCIHSPEFKQHERIFEHYTRAKKWQKKHKEEIFNGRP